MKKTEKKSVSSGSTSSEETEPSKTRTEKLLELGSLIAGDIGAEEHRNVTGQWIAHHLAEKIEAARTDPTLEGECADLILKLWSSRRDFPQGDPFGRYEKLFATLQAYFSDDSRIVLEPRPEDPPEKELVHIASEIDQSSRHLVKAILKEAFRRTGMENDELLATVDEVVPDKLTRYARRATRLPLGGKERETEESGKSARQEKIPSGEFREEETDCAGPPDDIARAMKRLDDAVRRYERTHARRKAD